MRVRELEAWLHTQGWQRQPNRGGSTVRWQHADAPGKTFTYHVPHGTNAHELRPDVVRAIHKRLAALSVSESADAVS